MKQERTLGESVFIILGAGVAAIGMVLAVIPIDLAFAWMRTQVWNWFFVPYLHVPHMTVWLMFAIILFVHMFRSSTRSLKDDHYKESSISAIVTSWVVEALGFGILYGVHLWALK